MTQKNETHQFLVSSALWEIARNLRGSLVNKGLLVALGLVALDCLVVAHYQPASALAILRYTPPVPLFTGVLVNVTPAVLPTIIMATLSRSAVSFAASSPQKGSSQLIQAVALWGASFLILSAPQIGTWWLYGVLIFVGFALNLASWHWASELVDAEGNSILTPILTLLLVVTVVGSLLSSKELRTQLAKPYLPAENISIKNQSSPVSGYVLDVNDQWTTILDEKTRRVEILKTDSVTGRAICTTQIDKGLSPRVPLVTPAKASLPSCH